MIESGGSKVQIRCTRECIAGNRRYTPSREGDRKKKNDAENSHNPSGNDTRVRYDPGQRSRAGYFLSLSRCSADLLFLPLCQEWDGEPVMHSAARTNELEPDLSPRVRGSIRHPNEKTTSCHCLQDARNTRQTLNEYGSTLPDRQQSRTAQKRPCRFKLLHE